MKTILLSAALALAPISGAVAGETLPLCEFEDSRNCIWLASKQGNGIGQSFIDIEGIAYAYQPEVFALVEVAPDLSGVHLVDTFATGKACSLAALHVSIVSTAFHTCIGTGDTTERRMAAITIEQMGGK